MTEPNALYWSAVPDREPALRCWCSVCVCVCVCGWVCYLVAPVQVEPLSLWEQAHCQQLHTNRIPQITHTHSYKYYYITHTLLTLASLTPHCMLESLLGIQTQSNELMITSSSGPTSNIYHIGLISMFLYFQVMSRWKILIFAFVSSCMFQKLWNRMTYSPSSFEHEGHRGQNKDHIIESFISCISFHSCHKPLNDYMSNVGSDWRLFILMWMKCFSFAVCVCLLTSKMAM